MATQSTPVLAQNQTTKRWYVVTSWHKPGHPKTKYDVTDQIHKIQMATIEGFVKHMEEEAKKQEKGELDGNS